MGRMSPYRILWLACAVLALAACARKPDEQRLRETIAAMQTAVEQGRPRDFMASVAPDFTANEASVDHDGLANILRVAALRNEKIGVTLGPIDVTLQGSRATADVTATLTGSSGGLLPERGAIYAIHSAWKKEGAEWRVYSATWEQRL